MTNHIRSTLRCGALATFVVLLGAAKAAANVVTDWNSNAIGISVAAGRPIPETAIATAYMHIAVYDAISSIDGDYEPFAVRVNAVPPGASRNAAAIEAAYRTLANLYPAPTFSALLDQFTAAYNHDLGLIPNGQSKTDGMSVGFAAAQGLITLRANDGFRAVVPYTFQPFAAGVYQRTPGPDGTIATYAGPVTPWVAQFRPFALRSPDQFRTAPPPALGSAQWARDLNEVKAFGAASNQPNSRSAEQEEIGLFYGLINAALQIGHNLRNLAAAQNLTADVGDTARFFAQAFVTIADTQVACWDSKYHYNFWRPVTAIQHADIDGNDATDPDPNWLPQVVTPGHPEYPAAHGCVTSAYANAIAEFFGTTRLPGGITLTGATGHPDRFFDSTDDIIDEIIGARVYNGVHYRTSVIVGAHLGHDVAEWVADHHFRPVERHHRHGKGHTKHKDKKHKK